MTQTQYYHIYFYEFSWKFLHKILRLQIIFASLAPTTTKEYVSKKPNKPEYVRVQKIKKRLANSWMLLRLARLSAIWRHAMLKSRNADSSEWPTG